MNVSASTDLCCLVHLELSLGPLLLQLLLQSPTLCPPLPQSLLSSGLQLISGFVALLEQSLLLLPLNLLFALKETGSLNFTLAGVNCFTIWASRSTSRTLNSSSLCSCCSLRARSKDSFWSTGNKESKDVPVSAYYRIQLWDGAKQKTRAERELKRKEKLLLQLDQEEAAIRKSCSCVFCCLTVTYI